MAESDLRWVGLDATGVPARPTGVGRYAIGLLDGLLSLKERKFGVLVETTSQAGRYFIRAEAQGLRVRTTMPSGRAVRVAFQERGLGWLARRHGASVFHGLHYQLPADLKDLAAVTTVHDMLFFSHPEWHEATKTRYFQRAITTALGRAQRVIVPSQQTADELAATFENTPPVHVIPHGVDYRFVGVYESTVEGPPELLYVGTIEPRKNLVRLIQAFDIMRSRGFQGRLRILGRAGWKMGEFQEALEASPSRGDISVLGYVNEENLRDAFRRARVVVYPSLAEGFGLPVLEALATGAPVLTSAGSAMAEVSGTFARLVDPTSVEDIAQGLTESLAKSRTKEEIARQIAWANTFTWQRSAMSHAQVYRLAAGGALD